MNAPTTSSGWQRHRDPVLARTVLTLAVDNDGTSAPLTVSVEELATVTWQPSKITIVVDEHQENAVLQVVEIFQNRWRSIRLLLKPLTSMEAQARKDVDLCYRVEQRHRHEWPRLFGLTQELARTRILISTLTSELESDPAELAPEAIKLLRKLVSATRLKAQLEQASDRYEVLEDLYEGGIDRINDHRYWRDGHWLEIIIIIVLVAETLLLFSEWVS